MNCPRVSSIRLHDKDAGTCRVIDSFAGPHGTIPRLIDMLLASMLAGDRIKRGNCKQ